MADGAKTTKIAFASGIRSDDTELNAEGYWADADKVRPVADRPDAMETIGGWSAHAGSALTGKARGGHAWTTLAGNRCWAIGTHSKLYASIDGAAPSDITPRLHQCLLKGFISTTNSSPTVTLTWNVYDPATNTTTAVPHGLNVGDGLVIVTFAGSGATVGGLTIDGTWTVATVPSKTTLTFTHSNNASGTATDANKYGAIYGTFASGLETGTADTLAGQPLTWSADNFGEDGVFNPFNRGLFVWQPATSYPELITSGNFSSATGWSAGTGWAIGGGVATRTGSSSGNLTQSLSSVLEAGKQYRLTFTLTGDPGGSATLQVLIDSTAIFPSITATAATGVSKTYDITFLCPASPNNLVFASTGSSSGTGHVIDNVSLKKVGEAFQVIEAPARSLAMFVTGEAMVMLLGTFEADGDFNSLLARHSDRGNLRTWINDGSNLAGEMILSKGGVSVGGISTRGQSMAFTDDAAFAFQYRGDPAEVYAPVLMGVGCGLVSPKAVCENNGFVYWASKQNFFVFDGAAPKPINCTVHAEVFGNIAQYQEAKSFMWINRAKNEFWFHYAHTTDGTEVSRYALYNFQQNAWSRGTLNRTTFIPAGIFNAPLAVDTSGNVWLHETGTAMSGDGITLPFLTSAYFDIEDGDTLLWISRMIPDFDRRTGSVAITFYTKMLPNGTEYTNGPHTFTTSDTKVDLRATGRQAKIKIASSATPTYWRTGALRLDIRPTGGTR